MKLLSIYEPRNLSSDITFTGMPALRWIMLEGFDLFKFDFTTSPSLLVMRSQGWADDVKEYSSEVFSQLEHSNLKVLNIGTTTNFSHFDIGFLSGFSKLQILEIEDSYFQNIIASKNLSNLKKLTLFYNDIQRPNLTHLSLLTGLKSLTIEMKIQVESNMFIGLNNLEILHLNIFQYNQCNITKDIFAGFFFEYLCIPSLIGESNFVPEIEWLDYYSVLARRADPLHSNEYF